MSDPVDLEKLNLAITTCEDNSRDEDAAAIKKAIAEIKELRVFKERLGDPETWYGRMLEESIRALHERNLPFCVEYVIKASEMLLKRAKGEV